ncbi:hypothetical protein BCR42DRAFT_113566 [Absidia repens]|uniref:Rap-GAP domain-containing protein n=1 Tax=Absidia repens TaxID=90262 RepID=A0A1X2I5Z8_9FUNG|nr:hypothetical protein BCR42DRAFT_113566 [Absidia repens]
MGSLNKLWRLQRTTSTFTDTDSSLVGPSTVIQTPSKISKTSTIVKKQPKKSAVLEKEELPFEVPPSSLSPKQSPSLSSSSPLERLQASSPPSLMEFYLFGSKNTLKNQLHSLKIPRQHPAPYSVLAGILKCLLHILTTLQPTIHNSSKLIDSADTPSSYTLEPTCIITTAAAECDASWPDHLDRNTHWFRTFFCGKDYTTSLVPIYNKQSPSTTYAIVTVIQEPILTTTTATSTTNHASRSNDPTFTKIDPCQYRLIVRHPNHTIRQVVSSTQAHHYLTGKNGSQKRLKHQRRSLRGYHQQIVSSSSQRLQDNLLTAAISSVCPESDMTKAVYLNAETTMACHLEKDLLHLDEIEIPPSYKFGVLTIKNNQTTEEEWFSNTDLTPSFDHFLTLIGKRIQLQGYNGYSAGLDTKTGETGDTSVVSRWKDYEIMFHVAPLMPYRQNDKQQVQRKRYIGNDIVCLVFLEGDAIFDPKAIRSKFLHVYIVVRQEKIGAKHRWRIEVVRKNNVPEFGPSLPNPPLFYDDESLQKFLIVKLINAENASLKCDNFSIPNNRARAGILESMVEKGLTQGKQRPSSTNSTTTNKVASTLKRQKSQSQRHTHTTNSSYSSTGDRLSRGSFHSIRSNPDNGTKPAATAAVDPPVPPVPSPTRSTILQDLKRFALRRTPTLPSLQLRTTTTLKEEPLTPPDDGTSTDDDEKKQPFHFTNSLLTGSSGVQVHHGNVPNGESMIQRSFLAAKAKLPATTTTSHVPSYPQMDGFRYKADNLMINVIGRRSTSTSRPMASSLPE